MLRNTEIPCEECPAAKFSCFDTLDKADIAYLNDQKMLRFIKKGETLYEQGNNPLGIYCLREGRLKLYQNGKDGREHIVRIAMPGELIGLKALVGGNPHSVSATAMENSLVCFILKIDFLQLMVKYPDFTKTIVCTLSKLLDEAESRLISLAYKPVRERLAETLLYLHHIFLPNGVASKDSYLNLTRMDLANIIGVAQETLIRILAEFREEKVIQVKGRKIFLTDIDRLNAIANPQN
jgi:CRP-like cAMP-binding protein